MSPFHKCFSYYFAIANQLPDFPVRGTLAANGLPKLRIKQKNFKYYFLCDNLFSNSTLHSASSTLKRIHIGSQSLVFANLMVKERSRK